MKYIWGFIILKLLGPEIRDHVVWFFTNFWWVILVFLILGVIGWVIEWKEKRHKRVINKKRSVPILRKDNPPRQTYPSESPPLGSVGKGQRMNKKQRWVLFVSAAVVILMLLFPPFHFPIRERAFNAGYGCLFDPPEDRPTVNTGMLLVEWVAVILAGGILWFALRDKD